MSETVLKLEKLTIKFGGLTAVSELDTEVKKGEIHALIGPNGSGKTTTLNMVTSMYRPTSGKVYFNGQDITGLPTHVITKMGISRTFQNILLFGQLSVLENVMVARHCRSKAGVIPVMLATKAQRAEEEEIRERSIKALELVGLDSKKDDLARNLPYGHQRLLEIARALATEPSLLLLDEPNAGMNPNETVELMALIKKIRDIGHTIFLVEHNMKLVMGISDVVTVLNFGKRIAEGTTSEVQNNQDVIQAYLGRRRTYAAS